MLSDAPAAFPSAGAEELFDRVIALAPEARAAWLARAGLDPAPRAELESLLQAHEEAEAFLADAAPDLPAATPRPEERPGDRVGRYQLLQKLGEGGCGVVYLAEQAEGVRRQVALKVIKLGMDTKAVIARFEAERQALARMEHANIARVLDAGATDSGRPFFVMELVRGMRITDYCDQNSLTLPQRLELFIEVCHAIQHAHHKGIIHRDIKPSNILVTLHDGRLVPKVIDFGIAKATQGRLADATVFTAVEQFIGTPAYVSPEQADRSGLDVDPRSDLYSLGVLLYELLCGRTPFCPRELTAAGLDAMRRRIREEEPLKPSVRLRALGDSDRAAIARQRGTDLSDLALQLRGDLDWIVMRCLEKDRSRRYESASELAADVRRYLDQEPVVARPPSTFYVLQKLVHRHRTAVVAGSALAVVLGAGVTVAISLYLREGAARLHAIQVEARVVEERKRADLARAEEQRLHSEIAAEKNRAQLETGRRLRIASSMNRTVQAIGLLFSAGASESAFRQVFDEASQLRTELADQPELAANVGEVLGGAYFRLGDHARAESLFRDALHLRRHLPAADPFDITEAMKRLGLVFRGQGRWTEAESCQRELLALQQQMFGAQHPDVARSQSDLGWVLAQQARLGDAERQLRFALELQRPLRGAATIDAASTLVRLGSVLMQEGRITEAERALREGLGLQRQVLGPRSPALIGALNVLAVTLALDQRRLTEAIELYREACDLRPPEAPGAAASGRPAGLSLTPSTGSLRRENPLLDAMLARPEPMTEVTEVLVEARRFVQGQYAQGSWEEAFYLALNVWVLVQERKFAAAEALGRQCLAIRERLRPDDWSVFHMRHLLGAARAGQQQFADAELLLLEGYAGMKQRVAEMPEFHLPRLGESVQRIIHFYRATGRTDQVAAWQAEFDRLAPAGKRSLAATVLSSPAPLASSGR